MDFYVFRKIIMSIDVMRIGEQLAHHNLLALDSGYYRVYIRSCDESTSHLRLAYLKLVEAESMRVGVRQWARSRLRRHNCLCGLCRNKYIYIYIIFLYYYYNSKHIHIHKNMLMFKIQSMF